MARAIVLLIIVGSLAAPVWAQGGRPVSYVTVAAGQTSGIRQPLLQVVRDQDAWEALWRRHAGGRSLPAPAVDFSRQMVVAVFAGESEAQKVSITRIVEEQGRLVVWYGLGEMRPLPDGPAQMAAPFHIVRLARSPLTVEFRRVKQFPVVVPQP